MADAVHIGIDISGHSDIHNHQRDAISFPCNVLGFITGQDNVRASGHGNDDVGIQHARPAISDRHRSAAEFFRQLAGPRR